MNTITDTMIRNSMMLLNPPRHVPSTPAIFCSCGDRAEESCPLPYHDAQFRIQAEKPTISAKILKSRRFSTSKGFRKLSPGTRSYSTGVI